LSDVHTEFHPDCGQDFIDHLDPSGVDVLVVAGDLGSWETMEGALRALCRKFPHVVYVLGNHEWYRWTNKDPLPDYPGLRRRMMKEIPNLHWLERDIWTYEGVRFLGSTLWFPDEGKTLGLRHNWSDFIYIPHLSSWMFKENKRAVAFFKQELRQGDVAVTHYLPTWASVAKWRLGNTHNLFYLTDLHKVILDKNPALWLHGHTHDSLDYEMGDTRVVCNPFGYVKDNRLNFDFDWKKVIELEAGSRRLPQVPQP